MSKKIVISAVNFFEGGPLSILKECLLYLNNSKISNDFIIYALVHRIELFDIQLYNNIRFLEFPKARKSYIFRLYYEYFYFRKFAKKFNISFWLSMHDISPNLEGVEQAVYCHNPSPFNTINFKDLYFQPSQFLFRFFYKYLYRININKNKYIIVQQQWLRDNFIKLFNLEFEKIIVALPNVESIFFNNNLYFENQEKLFFFPTYPRPFKNIEIICEAAKILSNDEFKFKVIITIDGSENNYSKSIVNKYNNLENIEFIGLITRDEVYKYYGKIDCLVFPSKLETWGLPISEFKQFQKPILCADLPYAVETVSDYEFVSFFNQNNPHQLAGLMKDILKKTIKYEKKLKTKYDHPYAENWNQLFEILLN